MILSKKRRFLEEVRVLPLHPTQNVEMRTAQQEHIPQITALLSHTLSFNAAATDLSLNKYQRFCNCKQKPQHWKGYRTIVKHRNNRLLHDILQFSCNRYLEGPSEKLEDLTKHKYLL